MVQWLIFAVGFATLVGSIIGVYVRHSSKIAVLENENESLKKSIKRCEDDLKLHITLNEKTFEVIEHNMKEINQRLLELIGYFKAMNKMDLG